MAVGRVSRAGVAIVGVAALVALTGACILMGALASVVVGDTASMPGGPVDDIPADYLSAYRAAAVRFRLGPGGWSYLAAIGKVESDHGRSTAPGVHSGQNTNGCCAGPMQIHNGFGSGGGTWGSYKVDGDLDRRLDIYDPDDAIATAANYLRASGAPSDWRRALFAYNHASWYVAEVQDQAAEYRRSALMQPPISGSSPRGSAWLAEVPGFPGERCDARIVPDVVALVSTYGLRVIDCFGGAPHALEGEHPLGLALDAAPADGDWRRTERLARDAGWRPACAASGCARRGPFRVVLYNGYPGHGDPQHSLRPHLHLSWQHGPAAPFTPAPWVRTLVAQPRTSP